MRSAKSSEYLTAVLVLCVGMPLSMESAGPPARKPLSSYDANIHTLLSKMTLEEKIGQMTQAEQDQLKNIGDIQKYYLGSVLSGGNSDPKEGNSLQAWTDMYDRYQSEALKTRLAIPLLYGVDAVHGHNNVLGAMSQIPINIGDARYDPLFKYGFGPTY